MPDDESTALEELLRQLEERLLEPAVRRDAGAVANLLGDHFREFGSSGRVFNKPRIIEELQEESPPGPVTLTEFQVMPLAPGIALVTYHADRAGNRSLRSSVWVLRDDRWQMLFHQGTKVPSE